MKKTLFAMLALATMMPAMADNWKLGAVWADTYNNDTDYTHYSFYLHEQKNTTASIVSSAIQEKTLSEFLADAGQRYDATQYSIYNEHISNDIFARPTTNFSDSIALSDIWAVSVYQNGDDAMFQVITGNPDTWLLTYTWGLEHTAYASFSSGSPTTPEPATATLSLLALAGLATRRKRK